MLICKGTLRHILSEFIDWIYIIHVWYFRLWFNSPPPPPFLVSKYSIYRQCVTGRGWGLLSPVGDHILHEGV
jgi:hypothetical protein